MYLLSICLISSFLSRLNTGYKFQLGRGLHYFQHNCRREDCRRAAYNRRRLTLKCEITRLRCSEIKVKTDLVGPIPSHDSLKEFMDFLDDV
jgi:hypothetical protein